MRCYSIALARDGFGVLGTSLSQQIAAITALVSLRSEKEVATVVKKSAGRKAALARCQPVDGCRTDLVVLLHIPAARQKRLER